MYGKDKHSWVLFYTQMLSAEEDQFIEKELRVYFVESIERTFIFKLSKIIDSGFQNREPIKD